MRVLFADQFAHIGGGQMCFLDLLPTLRNLGWEVHAAIPGEGPFADRLLAAGASVDFFGGSAYRPGRKSIRDMIRFPFDVGCQTRHFASLAARYKPDLLYVNGPRVLPAATLAAQGIPLLFHAHNHVQPLSTQRLLTSCVKVRDTAVIACSRSVGKPYRNLTPANLTVVPNGVPDHGYRERFRSPLVNPRIGIVGRITPGKGHLEFLQSAERLLRTVPDARFVICGSPGEEDGNYMAGLLEIGRGLPVEWLGWREDMTRVLQDLDILMISSVAEGLPRVMLEAFSAGVPVVAFPAGGIPEAIRDGDTGFLVRQRSAQAFADRLDFALRSEGDLRRVSASARREWEQHYTVDRYCTEITSLMERAVRR